MTQTSLAATRYVSPSGDDAGPGTAVRPWRTPAYAAEQAQPGDRILLQSGTYPLTQPLALSRSGTPDGWIVFAAAPGAQPVLDASGWRPKDEGEASWRGAVELIGPAYVRLEGLRLQNSYGYGFLIRGPSHHVELRNCRVDRTFACGIGAWNAAWVRVVGCEVTGANIQDMRLYGDRQHECPHEAISVAGIKHFEVAWNQVHDCGKEGIDVKEVSAHGVVHHNWVHDMPRQGMYTDAWFGTLEDVEWYSNAVQNCEWGLVISAEGKDARLQNVRAHHNVIWRSRGSGFFFGVWGSDGPRTGVRLDHNTLYANGQPHHWAGATGNIDVRSHDVRDVTIAHNLCDRGGAFEIATFLDPKADAARFAALGLDIRDNLLSTGASDTRAPSPYGAVYADPGQAAQIADPRLTDSEHGDFRPRPDSPAFRPGDYAGAFPPDAHTLPPPGPPLTGFAPYRPLSHLSGWPAFLSP